MVVEDVKVSVVVFIRRNIVLAEFLSCFFNKQCLIPNLHFKAVVIVVDNGSSLRRDYVGEILICK